MKIQKSHQIHLVHEGHQRDVHILSENQLQKQQKVTSCLIMIFTNCSDIIPQLNKILDFDNIYDQKT